MLPTYASTVPGPAPAQLGGAPPFGGYPTLPVAETTSQKIYVPNNLVGGTTFDLYIPLIAHNYIRLDWQRWLEDKSNKIYIPMFNKNLRTWRR